MLFFVNHNFKKLLVHSYKRGRSGRQPNDRITQFLHLRQFDEVPLNIQSSKSCPSIEGEIPSRPNLSESIVVENIVGFETWIAKRALIRIDSELLNLTGFSSNKHFCYLFTVGNAHFVL
jgi:hypothetical protein